MIRVYALGLQKSLSSLNRSLESAVFCRRRRPAEGFASQSVRLMNTALLEQHVKSAIVKWFVPDADDIRWFLVDSGLAADPN
jgi:hypothetical protein